MHESVTVHIMYMQTGSIYLFICNSNTIIPSYPVLTILIVLMITRLIPSPSVQSTIVPFKSLVTLVTVKVDTNGRVSISESLVTLKKIFDSHSGRFAWGDTGVTIAVWHCYLLQYQLV